MSISKTWMAEQSNIDAAVRLYRSPRLLTLQQIADELGTTFHNVQHAMKVGMPQSERKAQKALRYSATKKGSKNPMWGKKGEEHHNWKGQCEDGYGYLTCLHDGKRQFVHRVVMAEALGLREIPESFSVHHIDGDTRNNALDNLALVTNAGHQALHYMQAKDSLSLQLKRSTLAEVLRSMTSP